MEDTVLDRFKDDYILFTRKTQNTFQIEDEFKFYFPEIDSALINNFKPIPEIILSNKNNEILNQAYEIIHNFFNKRMKNRAKQDMSKNYTAKFDDLLDSENKCVKCIMKENFYQSNSFLIEVKSFMMHH